MGTATARANANIAFIKYWGNQNDQLRLPVNPSISMNLGGLYAETTVTWDGALNTDSFALNGKEESGGGLERVSTHLDVLRARLGFATRARVESANNFPTGAGIASSAAAFAALSVAGAAAAGAQLSERELTTIARLGSGSASRSVPTGFVEWYAADTHEGSFAQSMGAPEYWDIVDVIAVVSKKHKDVGSSAGHKSANTSDLQGARVAGAGERFAICRQAILDRDFATFAQVVEHDSNLMHAVMMTSRPPLFYWLPPTLAIMEAVRQWRAEGLRVCYTLDAGPNVHCICVREDAQRVSDRLRASSDVLDVLVASPGAGAQVTTVSIP
ncbi:MAG: diphosphomevalonate decarboxylase [Chloroflexi bacterium]|uniref:diphosphomevalonate decarboxylase n=1 Tax=Candidatus Flexifilum breve TaxID=3140694 RepID=UPI0031354F82|nr:diphosphomevalonate decarboxylase [Chloroflexota bacterium]